ncbi:MULTISPECIES: hypothetical protein [Acidithrix]|uniref:Transposase n=1 Tax=Acidithrix ferrooxidans TaxID=1280514 RepID=A0A0D8HEY8_9ACTN|nr:MULTISPECIES: hypothetical protein [Acidithrix]KJF15631.1 hypothetical protein AXFE_35030 [Acidithrix ferrooxidans]KJF16052.1 hypothetical protein AXFE_30730 [Acidithrix ferrooxidans]CAG4904796.1 unnamed protein product [Acidithrix sp. C25]
MKPYPKDQKEAVVKRLRELLSDPNAPRGAIADLAKQVQIPKTTIYIWNRELKDQIDRQDPTKRTPASLWSSEAKFQAVLATATMSELQLGEYLRTKGILKEELNDWRITCSKANDKTGEAVSKYRSALASEKVRSKKFESELNRKEKALAETYTLLELLRKSPGDLSGTKRSNDLPFRSPTCK